MPGEEKERRAVASAGTESRAFLACARFEKRIAATEAKLDKAFDSAVGWVTSCARGAGRV